MKQQAKQSSSIPAASGGFRSNATYWIVLGVAAVVFICATVILGMLTTSGRGLTDPFILFGVAGVIALMAAPIIHWLVYLPAQNIVGDDIGAREMSALTVTDPLTHLMNRRGVIMGVLEAMAQAERYNTPLSVALVDIDHFKRVNDEFGNHAGDKVLAEFAGVLADTLRMPDKLGRYDGEEFLAVLPHTGLTPARKIAERIRSTAAAAKLNVSGKRIGLTVSVGVTQYNKGEDLENLLSRANAAVREAKRDDGNRVITKKSR
jgi:diguanylate cyclase (GGDEF)-like protein